MTRPRYIDIHAHTNFSVFAADRRETVERALRAGIWMINIGTQRDTSKKAVDMTAEFPEGVYAIVGLHPVHVNPSFHDADEIGPETKAFASRGEDFDKEYYRGLVSSAPKGKVVGIGECGLDYYRRLTENELARQKKAFRGQIELALECDLPLMLHIRPGEGGDAYRDALDMLAGYRDKLSRGEIQGPAGEIWSPERLRGDAHFFAGSVEQAKEFLALGFHLSYTGVVTFPPRAIDYAALVRATPLDRIMSETDSPYVAPVPHRGARNEPLFVADVADMIASIKGIAVDECRAALVDNAFRLFKLVGNRLD